MIAQHTDGTPLKPPIDTESVIGVNEGRTRVRYANSNEPGSVGSSVFNLDWNLVALHHRGIRLSAAHRPKARALSST